MNEHRRDERKKSGNGTHANSGRQTATHFVRFLQQHRLDAQSDAAGHERHDFQFTYTRAQNAGVNVLPLGVVDPDVLDASRRRLSGQL